MKLILITLSCALLAGCASLTPGGRKVRATDNADLVKNCKFIKQVVTSGLQATGVDYQIMKLRNLTAEAGGDMVYVENRAHNNVGQSVTGSAYNCGTPTPAAK